MDTIKKCFPVLLAVPVVITVMGILLTEPVQAAKPGGGPCPKIYAPVVCDNGKTYPNQCVADRRHAENCEPVGLPLQAGKGGGQPCPKIYAPVVCDNGKTYPNQCVADRHHAENCEPVGLP